MMIRNFNIAAALMLAASGLVLPPGAGAATFTFNAVRQNVDAPSDGTGRCGAGRITVDIGPGPVSSASGTSNLGAFSAMQGHCVTPSPPPISFGDGLFEYAFEAGDLLSGTYFGVLSATSVPGVFTTLETYLATGGTGRFLGATGSFVGNGTVDFTGPTPVAQVTFEGALNLPAVPEPATWAMLLIGFGTVGGMMRRRKSIIIAA